MSKQQQIQRMLKERVLDQKSQDEYTGFLYNFLTLVESKVSKLSKNIFGDYNYQRKNRFSVDNKLKILKYLKEKYLIISRDLQQQNKKNFYNYDINFFAKKLSNLTVMRQMLLQGKSQIEAAEGGLQRLKYSRNYIKAQFLNEAAYQFDRQRYCSIFWGLMTGSLINATIYKRGRTARKAALLVTIAHVFGQISYHMTLDKYFDSVYKIFEQQAERFVKQQKKLQKDAPKRIISNEIQ